MNKREKIRRVVAMVGVVIIALMFIATFVVACLPIEGGDRLFIGFLGLDIIIPSFLWLYLYLIKRAEKTDNEQYKAAKEEYENKKREQEINKEQGKSN